MLFKKKIDRLVDMDKAEQRFREDIKKEKLEKNDKLAMALAALLVFVPAILVVLAVLGVVIWLFMLR